MVAEASTEAASVAVQQRRRREEELLVWPDLVFIEFIAAMVFLLAMTILAIAINAPLLDRANPAVTPNPSKAPWYFLNLQELLLHMHPALAGVVVPTVALIALGAIPYFDNSSEGQGAWFSTPRAVANAVTGAVIGTVGSILLVLWDGAKHVVLYERVTGEEWPTKLAALRNARSLQTDIGWPEDWDSVPLGDVLRFDLLGFPEIELNWNVPGWIVEQVIPITLMIGLPLLMSFVLHRMGLAQTKREHMIAQFSGFMAVFLVLTIIGTAFRGAGMELLPPWEVKPAVS